LEYRAGMIRRTLNAIGTGFERTPGTYPVEGAGVIASYGSASNAQVRATDTGGGGADAVFYSASGEGRIWRSGADRVQVGPIGTGIGRSAGSYLVESAGIVQAVGAGIGASLKATDTTAGTETTFYSANSKGAINHSVYGDAVIVDGAGRVGLDGTAANNPLEVYGSGSQLLSGANAGYFHYDRTVAGQYFGLYANAATQLMFDSIHGSAVQISGGKVGMAGTSPGTYQLAVGGTVQATGSGPGFRANDTSGAHESVWYES